LNLSIWVEPFDGQGVLIHTDPLPCGVPPDKQKMSFMQILVKIFHILLGAMFAHALWGIIHDDFCVLKG
jgi:hypothetical protein